MGLIGEVEGQNAVIIDDIIDTGGTILKAVDTLNNMEQTKLLLQPLMEYLQKVLKFFKITLT